MKVLFVFAAALSLSLAGCSRIVYELELKPQGDSLSRTLTVWQQSTNQFSNVTSPPVDITHHLVKVYGDPAPGDFESKMVNGKDVYTGLFTGEMPQDIGGSGEYRRYESELGELFIYRERFRGDIDIAASLEHQQAALDQFIDLIADWMNSEIKDPQLNQKADQLLRNQVRADLRNIGLYVWTHASASRLVADYDYTPLFAYLSNFLIERDYISIQDLPQLSRLLVVEDSQQTLNMVLRMFATKLGIDRAEPIPSSFDFLKDVTTAEQSLRDFLRTTDAYQQRLSQWKKTSQQPDQKAVKEPEPLGILTDTLVGKERLWSLGGSNDQVRVRLHCSDEPIETNGKWDAEAGLVEWEDTMDRSPMHAFVYAVWSTPNEANQESSFGQEQLRGRELGQYVAAYSGMLSEEKAAWDCLLATMTSETTRTSFEGEFVVAFPDAPKVPVVLRDLIMDALKAK